MQFDRVGDGNKSSCAKFYYLVVAVRENNKKPKLTLIKFYGASFVKRKVFLKLTFEASFFLQPNNTALPFVKTMATWPSDSGFARDL